MRFSYSSGSRPLDGYTIKRGIGIGGFGEVYFALNDAGKEVALKKIQRNMDIELRGVRHCLNLKHVNLISLWDIRSNEFGESWVVMEYVPGPSLRDVIENHQTGLPEEEVKRWFTSTASGVAYLHEHGIVHRDLKPGNIFLDEDEHVIKIGDYGLSKFISCSRRSGQTESVGTFHYMAPEIGKGEYGKEIDIYALGIILFEMVTGQVPFEGESTQEIIMKHLTMDPDVSVVPEPYRQVIAKALRKDPQRRYSNVSEMILDLPWPDIAAHADQIVGQQRVGRIRWEHPPAVTAPPTAEHPGEAGQNRSESSVVEKLPPVIIGDDAGIRLGPLKDRISHPRLPLEADSTSPPSEVAPQKKSDIHFIDDDYPARPTDAGGTPVDSLLPSAGLESAGASRQGDVEPIAGALHQSLAPVVRWWNNTNVSTPVRLGLLAILGVVVIQNSSWLLPVVVSLALVYLVYYLVRKFVWNAGNSDRLAQAETRRANHQRIRRWLNDRPSSDQVTELVGSLLLGALGAIAFSLLGLAIGGGVQESSMEIWALFTWQTLVSVAAVWTVLVVTKSWSQTRGEWWFRSLMIVLAGAAIGAVSFFSAGSFEIDLARVAMEDFQSKGTASWVWHGVPMMPAMLLGFGALFGMARLGAQTDPLRRTRLSVTEVVSSLVIAAILSHLFNIPLTVMCIVAVVVSVSIQLSSPWLHPDQQWEILQQQDRSVPSSSVGAVSS